MMLYGSSGQTAARAEDSITFFTKGSRLSAGISISILAYPACDMSDKNIIRAEITGAVGPPETVDAASLANDSPVKAFE